MIMIRQMLHHSPSSKLCVLTKSQCGIGSPYLVGGRLFRYGRLPCSGGSGALAGGGLGESGSPTGEGLHRGSSELVYPPAGAFDKAWA